MEPVDATSTLCHKSLPCTTLHSPALPCIHVRRIAICMPPIASHSSADLSRQSRPACLPCSHATMLQCRLARPVLPCLLCPSCYRLLLILHPLLHCCPCPCLSASSRAHQLSPLLLLPSAPLPRHLARHLAPRRIPTCRAAAPRVSQLVSVIRAEGTAPHLRRPPADLASHLHQCRLALAAWQGGKEVREREACLLRCGGVGGDGALVALAGARGVCCDVPAGSVCGGWRRWWAGWGGEGLGGGCVVRMTGSS